MTEGLFWPEQWPDWAEWWEVRSYRPDDKQPTVGLYCEGEHVEEFDKQELGTRVAAFLEGENPPYPGWCP